MLGDPVPHRIHWPKMADLRINSMQYRPYGRAATTKLGINARDEPASVGVMCSAVRRSLWLPNILSVALVRWCLLPSFCVLPHKNIMLLSGDYH